jgi:5-methylthioribose kinase
LPDSRREKIAAIIETLFHGDLHPESALTDEKISDLRKRLANSGPIATEAEVEAFFARFKA